MRVRIETLTGSKFEGNVASIYFKTFCPCPSSIYKNDGGSFYYFLLKLLFY